MPIAFTKDEIVSGNLPEFIVEERLVIYHPEHRDNYFRIVIRISREPDTAYIHKYIYGGNLQTVPDNKPDKNNQKKTNMIKLKRDKSDAENNYFAALKAIFEYVRC